VGNMSGEGEILEKARRLFDAVGVAPAGGESVVVLGLLTTPERDLDDFFRDTPGSLRLRGFEIHAMPKLEELLRFIREQGMVAELWGRCGYPRGDDLNLKRQAVIAGLGRWGKNSLVIHPEFGPWLRFMGIRVRAELTPTGPGADNHEENPLCDGCSACIDACPMGIIKPYFLTDRTQCRASVSSFPRMGRLVACDRCLAACPVGK